MIYYKSAIFLNVLDLSRFSVFFYGEYVNVVLNYYSKLCQGNQ